MSGANDALVYSGRISSNSVANSGETSAHFGLNGFEQRDSSNRQVASDANNRPTQSESSISIQPASSLTNKPAANAKQIYQDEPEATSNNSNSNESQNNNSTTQRKHKKSKASRASQNSSSASIWHNSISRMSNKFSLFGGSNSSKSAGNNKLRHEQLDRQREHQLVQESMQLGLDSWIETKVVS